jgi:hypothetical protein
VACGASLRPLRLTRFRRSRCRIGPDELTARIAQLVGERQELRARGAGEAALERNRLQIARAQWELAHALIDLYVPQAEAKTAA